jgi:choline dehydrogenase
VSYQSHQRIPISESSNWAEAGLFVRTPRGNTDYGPDVQFHFLPVQEVAERGGDKRGDILFVVNTARPESRGVVRLRSRDPDKPPIIEANYLTGGDDVLFLRNGISIARRLARTKALSQMGTWRIGTDSHAVVDATLKVYGLEGLRVIASVMPTIASGNTNASTIMIAEKGAEFVRES